MGNWEHWLYLKKLVSQSNAKWYDVWSWYLPRLLKNKSSTHQYFLIHFPLSFNQLLLCSKSHFKSRRGKLKSLNPCSKFGLLMEILSEEWEYVLTYIYKTNIQLFGCISSLEVASGIDVIVSYNSSNYVWGWDTFSSLCWYKHSWWKWKTKRDNRKECHD